MAILKVLCIGDVAGITGRIMFQKYIERVRTQHRIDFVMVNGENSADSGRGITSKIVHFFLHNKVDVITTGNHIWYEREIYPHLDQTPQLLRPANFPRENPGIGVGIFSCKDYKIAVINVQGRVFMKEHVDCPFRTVDTILTYLKDKTSLILVDVHAETTSEKIGLGWYLDGRVSAVIGTHTHVPTADERILPQGTAFVTDLGMVGAYNSMLGMKKEPIIKHLLTQMPVKFEAERSSVGIMTGVVIELDTASGRARTIERIKIVDDHLDDTLTIER